MSRARRVVFGLLVVLLGTFCMLPLVLMDGFPKDLLFLGFLIEVALIIVGVGIAVTAPPEAKAIATDIAEPPPEPLVLGPSSAYRGASPPAPVAPITRTSAKRITIGILAALAFTAAAVPLAVHLPRWIQAEVVVGLWWAVLSGVLAVVAYRGAKVQDDHRPSTTPAVDLSDKVVAPKVGTVLEAISDPEGCVIALVVLAVVAVAMAGAWLLVELVAPAVFIVAYRAVVAGLSKAYAANTRGDWLRSTVSGMGWAAFSTFPLALVVVIAHQVMALRAS